MISSARHAQRKLKIKKRFYVDDGIPVKAFTISTTSTELRTGPRPHFEQSREAHLDFADRHR